MNDPTVRRTIAVFGVTTVLYSIVDKLFGVGYVVRMSEQGLTAAEIGVLVAVGSIVLAIVDFPAGNLADVWGRKRTAGIGAIVLGTGLLAFGLASSMVWFALAIVLWAVGVALISGAPSAWLVDELARKRADHLRTRTLSRVSSLAMLAGAASALGATVLLWQGPAAPLAVGAAVAVAAAVVLLTTGTDNRGSDTARRTLSHLMVGNIRDIVRDPAMRLILCNFSLRHVGFTSFVMSYPLLLTQELGVPVSAMGAVLALSMICLAAGSWVTPIVARHVGLGRTAVVGSLVSAAGYGVMSLSSTWPAWVVGLVVFELGLGLDLAAVTSWMHDFVAADNRASWLSAATSVQTLAGVVGTAAAGSFITLVGFRPVWIAATLASALAAMPLVLLARRAKYATDVAAARTVEPIGAP